MRQQIMSRNSVTKLCQQPQSQQLLCRLIVSTRSLSTDICQQILCHRPTNYVNKICRLFGFQPLMSRNSVNRFSQCTTTNSSCLTNHQYLKEPSWDAVLQRQVPDASHTLPWCFSVASQMPSDAFGCLSYVSQVIQITCICTCSCMLPLAVFLLDLSVKWQVTAQGWSPHNYAVNSSAKCFTCLEASVMYSCGSRQ